MPAIATMAGSSGYGRSQASSAAPSNDKIAQSLTTSLSAYNSATTGSWIKITAAEYANLQVNVASTSIAGITTAKIPSCTFPSLTSGTAAACSVVSAVTPSIPANTYVYAVLVKPGASITGFRIYTNTNTSLYTGFTQLGGNLPTSSSTGTDLNYYVLKNNTTTVGSADSILGFYHPSIINMYLGIGSGFGAAGVKYNTSTGGTITTSTNFGLSTYSNNSGFCIQALATTTVQW